MKRTLVTAMLLTACVVEQNMGQRCASDDAVCIEHYANRAPTSTSDSSMSARDGSVFGSERCPCDAGWGVWNGQTCSGCSASAPNLPDYCTTGVFFLDSRINYQSTAATVCKVVPLDAIPYPALLRMSLHERARNGRISEVVGCLEAVVEPDAGPGIGWRASLRGRMDCTNGLLEGEVRSTYSVVTLCSAGLVPERFFAKGTIAGSYDAQGQRFVDGNIGFREPKVLLSGNYLGGSGPWHGERDGSVMGPLIEQDVCLGAAFPEDVFLDAGI